jgi:hypothetical protein
MRHECLHMITPTMPRKGDPKYLIETINSISTRTSHLPALCVELTVVNMRPGTHTVFEQARFKFNNNPAIRFVARQSLRPVIDSPVPGIWRPTGANDVRQTNDAIQMFEELRDNVLIESAFFFFFF